MLSHGACWHTREASDRDVGAEHSQEPTKYCVRCNNGVKFPCLNPAVPCPSAGTGRNNNVNNNKENEKK